MLSLAAASLAVPAVVAFPASQAEARDYRYKEWRGRDGRMYCRKSDGTVGLVVGGVAGALVGRSIDTRGDRATGTIVGAAADDCQGRSGRIRHELALNEKRGEPPPVRPVPSRGSLILAN
jgi:hypothetical protein